MTTVTFRLEAACDTIRSGTPSSPASIRMAKAGSTRRFSPTAQSSAICGSIVTSANSRSAARNLLQPAIVVYRHRHAHLRRRHDVHGRAVALEHLEQPAEKAVRHQHARGRDFDDGDVALARERHDGAVVHAAASR